MRPTYTLEGNWRDRTVADLGGVREEPTACVVRYGAFGDMIQTASVLPRLKEQGFRVCVNTDPRGREVIEHDPHVDEWLMQEKNQVDPRELPEYWQFLSPMFAKWVNLTGSVEGRCLAMGPRHAVIDGVERIIPPEPSWYLTHAEREQKYAMNYMEEMHRIADVPFVHAPRFYPTLPETRAARIRIEKMRRRNKVDQVVMWVLSGSATHKVYPGMDDAIKAIFSRRPTTGFFFVGNEYDKFLGAPWRNEPRIVNLAGKQSIRETLALAQLVDVVVGPETGVLNAVSMCDNRKVVFLSHSSVENLTKHWRNTVSLHTTDECYPCHQLHLSSHECPLDITYRMPICTLINPGMVARAVMGPRAYDGVDIATPDTVEVRSA